MAQLSWSAGTSTQSRMPVNIASTIAEHAYKSLPSQTHRVLTDNLVMLPLSIASSAEQTALDLSWCGTDQLEPSFAKAHASGQKPRSKSREFQAI